MQHPTCHRRRTPPTVARPEPAGAGSIARQAGWTLVMGAALLGLVLPWNVLAAPLYPDTSELTDQLQSWARQHPKILRLQALAESLEGRPLWLAELGEGTDESRAARPALLVVAGLEGDDFAGTASVLHWLEKVLDGAETNVVFQELLRGTTVYVVPQVNPDAAESRFHKPMQPSATNHHPHDEDHDGLKDEDGADDLDGDGRITWMRVQGPEGEYVLDPGDARVHYKADRIKGETGGWRLFTEGADNDQDEAWNEDGTGGVNFNRNFPYGYRYFAADSGVHQISEPETRALADFVVGHPNIGLVMAFGAPDNLTETPKGEGGGKRPPEEIQNDDLPYYREFGKAWREALGLKKEQGGRREPGSFVDWIYFHRGRLALSAPAWTPELQVAWSKEQPKDEPKPDESKDAAPADDTTPREDSQKQAQAKPDAEAADKSKPEPDGRSAADRDFLAWLEKENAEGFVPWKRLEHPDFPGQVVEIGGIDPLARRLPPEKVMTEWAERQAGFLTSLGARLPRLGFRQTKLQHLGNGVYELSVQVENKGYLPTVLAQGATTREVFPTRVTLDLDPASLLGGTRRVTLGTIPGNGGMEEMRWVFHAGTRREVTLEIVSMLAGRQTKTLNLADAETKP